MGPKKLYYVPGLISIISLPVLLFIFGPDDPVQQNLLGLHLPTEKLIRSDSEFTKGNVLRAIKGRKVIDVALWDKHIYSDEEWGTYMDEQRASFIKKEIEHIAFTHDSTIALKVELSEANTYGEFVWLINEATVYGLRRYVFFDDAFYFFNNDPPVDYSKNPVDANIVKQIESITLKQLLGNAYQPPGKWKMFMDDLNYRLKYIGDLLKYNLPLSIGFLLLIIVPALYNLFKGRSKNSLMRIDV